MDEHDIRVEFVSMTTEDLIRYHENNRPDHIIFFGNSVDFIHAIGEHNVFAAIKSIAVLVPPLMDPDE